MSSNYALVIDEIKRVREEQELSSAQYCNKLIFSDVIVHMETKFKDGHRKPSQIVEYNFLSQAYNYVASFFY
jgi:hypothetical protein